MSVKHFFRRNTMHIMPSLSRKKVFCVLLACILCVLCLTLGYASAAAENEDLIPLANKKLLTLVAKHSGSDWQYFQPASRETEVDCSSDAFLRQISVYPVVAFRDGQYKLILLRKENNAWVYAAENAAALMRDQYRLSTFSMDELVSAEDAHLFVYFDFLSPKNEIVSLQLLLNPSFSFFRSISMFLSEPSQRLVTTLLEPYRGFTFTTDYYPTAATCSLSTSYFVTDGEDRSFSAETFDFQHCPVTLEDLFTPATCQEEVPLYAAPATDTLLPFSLSPGEAVDVILPAENQAWTLIRYQGNLFYCPYTHWAASAE